MPLITPEQAAMQTHADGVDADMLALWSGAAERAAMNFLNRRVFADAAELAAAVALVSAALTEADAAYELAREAAEEMDGSARCAALRAACALREVAVEEARATYAGIVVTDDVLSAMLLILGHLYRNREAVVTGQGAAAVELPMGAHSLLWPYRIGLGV